MRLLNYFQSTFPSERTLYNVILIYWTFLMYSTMIRIQHLLSCVPGNAIRDDDAWTYGQQPLYHFGVLYRGSPRHRLIVR